MVWLYERGDATLTIETRFDRTTQTYELIIQESDGSLRREQFATEAEFRDRLKAVTVALEHQRWRQAGPPTVDPDGWRL